MALVTPETRRRGLFTLGLLGRAFGRVWGRDVMLYVGGVSFFALLAVFPGLAILIGTYSLVFTPEQSAEQAAALAHVLPQGARALFQTELTRLSSASAKLVSYQSLIALVIGVYAAHRGFKALLAGLTFIHDEDEPHGFVRFNLLALFVALATFAFMTVLSGLVVSIRLVRRFTEFGQVGSAGWLDSEWLWAFAGLSVGLTCLYRYAMSHSGRVAWSAAAVGGATASLLSLAASWASAFYVDQIAELGATYGSVGAVVVFLIWLSWNVNVIFYGGALATEVEIAQHRKRAAQSPETADLSLSSARRAFRR